jgi:uncharacterized damage-inducible protein DinB
LRAVRATPEDKLEWKVLDKSRTVLDMLQECAQSPLWFAAMLEQRTGSVFDPAEYPNLQAERRAWSAEEAERRIHENSERLYAAIRSVPDEDLTQTISLPFGQNMVASLTTVMALTYWNLTYHLGQINFIQTLLDDWQMH